MNIKRQYICLLLIMCACAFKATAQQVKQQPQQNKAGDILYTAGHASAFIGGLYDAFFSYRNLKLHGDFGLGAPDKMDGELLMVNGKLYQTQSSGKTFEVKDTAQTPFAVVNFFRADRVLKADDGLTKEKFYAYLDSVLPNKNDIYAIHVKGTFKSIKTRAFPPVTKKPYLPLADLIPLQQFFTFDNIKGELVGYRLPAYMEGPNISGYHFHFLSDDKQGGGHIIDLLTAEVTIEIDSLKGFRVDLPQTVDFHNFDFKKDRREEVKRVENGKN